MANDGKFPLLIRLALDSLAIPAVSAAPERVSSIATVSSMGKADRLSGKNLERKVLSFRNTEFLPGVEQLMKSTVSVSYIGVWLARVFLN